MTNVLICFATASIIASRALDDASALSLTVVWFVCAILAGIHESIRETRIQVQENEE